MRRPLPLLAAALLFATASAQDSRPTFRAETRLVEVYATVLDSRGRYIDELSQKNFRVLDGGEPQRIVSFENSATKLSCAILLDTTGSMAAALPRVKSAIYRLIDDLRDGDPLAVYSFSNAVDQLQDFTSDKSALKKAVARTRAEGTTALFDAIARVAAEISPRAGKKAIVVFTDGDDNASVLNARRAVDRAKKLGIPVYTVAEGEALARPSLLDLLKELSRLTAGKSYAAKTLGVVDTIFRDIADELRHTYWLTFQPPPSSGAAWRQIQVAVTGVPDCKIRSREGYFPF